MPRIAGFMTVMTGAVFAAIRAGLTPSGLLPKSPALTPFATLRLRVKAAWCSPTETVDHPILAQEAGWCAATTQRRAARAHQSRRTTAAPAD
jgi:hypothetical protein